ncbi:MAG: GTP-binding protein [Candidatus Heimdallarchaeota archaeon]|nr:GTP-binding protein [Candidatus Heimdallarchaeota archaeon]
MSLEPKRAYKIVLIGDPEVGKTSIRRKYMGKSFRADYLKTLGADFAAQKVNVEGESVLLTIWDLAGQSIFHGMRSSFYHGCKCALVVFDVTNPQTLENCYKWADEAAKYAKSSLKEIYLIGNKIDLVDDRLVTPVDIQSTAERFEQAFKFPIEIYETSALTGENIIELFEHMSRRLIIGDETKEEQQEVQIESEKIEQEEEASKEGKEESNVDIIKMLESLEKRINSINDDLSEIRKHIKKDD